MAVCTPPHQVVYTPGDRVVDTPGYQVDYSRRLQVVQSSAAVDILVVSVGQRPLLFRSGRHLEIAPDLLYRLVTTVLDPTQAPANELAALYHERWEVAG